MRTDKSQLENQCRDDLLGLYVAEFAAEVLGRLYFVVEDLVHWAHRGWSCYRAEVRLLRLDDRSLKDIGLHRSAVHAAVAEGRERWAKKRR